MCISFSPPSANKKEITDNSFPVIFDETSILIPYPQETGKITALASAGLATRQTRQLPRARNEEGPARPIGFFFFSFSYFKKKKYTSLFKTFYI